jgi:tetratricopeptide (TPR) repeat protein
MGNYASAAAVYEDALGIWRRHAGEREIAWTLEMLGEAYWLMGDIDRASNYWMEALALFQATDEEFGLMILFHHLGQVERLRGEPTRAADYYLRVLTYFEKLDNLYFILRGLAGLGGVALVRGQFAAAAQLLAAAYRLLDSLPPFLAPADQQDYANLVARTCAALGDDGFRSAWEIGRNLNTEQAIRLGERQATLFNVGSAA